MKVLPVSELKRPTNADLRPYPADGTKAAVAYQHLFQSRGRPVCLDRAIAQSRTIGDLRDYYGCDIRAVGHRSRKYILAGEWFGSHYVDYVAAAIDAAVKAGEAA